MATALEKFDKIENVHEDGTSTKLSDRTLTTRESESNMETGKGLMKSATRKKKLSKCPWKCKLEWIRHLLPALLCDHRQHQFSADWVSIRRINHNAHQKLYQKALLLKIKIQLDEKIGRLVRIRCLCVCEMWWNHAWILNDCEAIFLSPRSIFN